MLSEHNFKQYDFKFTEIVDLSAVENIKIISDKIEVDYFMANIKLREILFRIFKIDTIEFEYFISEIYNYDPILGLLFYLNVLETDNSMKKTIGRLRQIKNNDLLSKILLSNLYDNNQQGSNSQIRENLIRNYFLSFCLSRVSIKLALRKILKGIYL